MSQPITHSQGSAKTLTGLIYPLVIFISEKGTPWSTKEKIETLRIRKVAEEWLSRQADRYSVNLAFHDVGAYGYLSDLVVDCIPNSMGTGEEYTLWVSFLLQKIGWNKPRQLHDHIHSTARFDNIHVEIYANATGRSYAFPFPAGGDQECYYLEGFIDYRFFQNGVENNPAVVAHELLHLYGAWDFGQNFQVSEEQAAHALRLYPKDIMGKNSQNIEELSVGPLTAWRVGWTNNKEDWYEFFSPKNGKFSP